jgi:hypothetical protein
MRNCATCVNWRAWSETVCGDCIVRNSMTRLDNACASYSCRTSPMSDADLEWTKLALNATRLAVERTFQTQHELERILCKETARRKERP